MYRLLFLFYIEARPELGYAPIAAEAYLKGYSLEHLRELEQVPLTTPEAQSPGSSGCCGRSWWDSSPAGW